MIIDDESWKKEKNKGKSLEQVGSFEIESHFEKLGSHERGANSTNASSSITVNHL